MKSSEASAVTSRLLESDLDTLSRLVLTHQGFPSEGDIRAAAGILRRWLCEGLIGRLSNQLGMTPTFPVFDNSEVFEALLSASDINFYLTGGVRMNGIPILSVYDSTAASPAEAGVKVGPLPQKLLTVGKMLRQPRLFYAGERFTCEQIIRFTANKLGGVHLDFERSARDKILDEAGRYMTFGSARHLVEQGEVGKLHLALETESREAVSGVHLEIVAASSSVLNLHVDNKPFLEFKPRRTLRGWA